MATAAQPPKPITPPADDADKNGARSAILLMIAVIVVAILAVEFGLQTLVWIETKTWASTNPWIRDVPLALPASATSAPPASTPPPSGGAKAGAKPPQPAQIKLYDYEFTAPWPGKATVKPAQSYSEVRFDSGQVIVFFDPQTQIDTIRDMKTQNAAGYQKLENVFGDRTPDSDFALYKTAYDAAPSNASPFMPRADAVRVNGALLYKLGFGYDEQPGIYSFDFGRNHGFQFGDLAAGRPVALRVFNDRDDQFRFIFTTAAGSGAKITQDEINVATQSLQPVPLLER